MPRSEAVAWTQEDVAAALRVSVTTVQRLDIPKVLVYVDGGHGQGHRPLIRYDPDEVRAWWKARVAAVRAAQAAAPTVPQGSSSPVPPAPSRRGGKKRSPDPPDPEEGA